MDVSPSIAAVRRFLRQCEGDAHLTIADLAQALDTLALAYHEAPSIEPAECDAEPPQRDYPNTYRALKARFPALGYYATIDPQVVPPGDTMVGDAVDDLADIVGDLSEASWRYDEIGADDAHWHLRFTYETHWGQHLRDLSRYLYTQIFR